VLNASWIITVALTLQSPAAPAPPPESAVWTDDRPLTRLLPNLQRDLVALPQPGTFAIVGAGALGAGVARPSDRSLARWVARAGESRAYTPIGSLLGNEWIQGGAAIATYWIGSVQDSPELTHIGGDLIRAQMLNGVMTVGVKLAAARTRPSGGDHSFPSGHTSSTFASATVLAEHYGWKVAVPAYAFAGFIGWTRIRDREHWLSDVVFGSAIGFAAGRTVTLGHGRSTWSIAPALAPGGLGIYVMRQ
jgi:membrane-associated phospholipid phosphatase